MKQSTETKIRIDLLALRNELAMIDEIMAPLTKQRRRIRRKINVAECRLQRAGKEK